MVKMAGCLASDGHQVTVLTGMPSYPTGILAEKYRRKLWIKEKDGKVDIRRVYEYPATSKGVFKRLLNNLSFMISATAAVFISPFYDCVIVSSPSFLSGIPGLVAITLNKGRFIFDIRDLWPDSIIELGLTKNRHLISWLKKLERYYYKKARHILAATPAIKTHLIQEGISENKITVLPNSVNTDIFKPRKANRTQYGLNQNDFIATFIGNHGRGYDLKTVLNCALFCQKYPQIKFLLVGEGEEKNNLIDYCQNHKIKNVIFLPEKNTPEIVRILNISNIGLISLSKSKNFQQSIPIKTSEYAACGKPMAAAIGGEVRRYLKKYHAGLVYPAGDWRALSRIILKFYRFPKLQAEMGRNARQLALEVFSDQKFYQTLDKIL